MMQRDRGQSICVAILAAGQSRRFGHADKLSQPLGGKILGHHVSDTARSLGCDHQLVVTAPGDHICEPRWKAHGYTVHVNPVAEQGMGTSVAMAAHIAADKDADGLLICLADMPFVTLDHFQQLIELFGQKGGDRVIASDNGRVPLPPAIFGKQHFSELANLSGTTGARGLLASAHTLSASAQTLMDIDRPGDLEAARRLIENAPYGL